MQIDPERIKKRTKRTVRRIQNRIRKQKKKIRRILYRIRQQKIVHRVQNKVRNQEIFRKIQINAGRSFRRARRFASAKLEPLRIRLKDLFKDVPPALPISMAMLLFLFIALALMGRIEPDHGGQGENEPSSVSENISENTSENTSEKEEKEGGVDSTEQDSALKLAVQSILSHTIREVVDLKEGAEQTMRGNFMEILDKGRGASYELPSESWRPLWEETRRERREQLSQDPFLLLVNKWHYQPDGYEVEPVTLPNGQQIGDQCYDQLMKMLEDCEKAGGTPIVCSGYRPHEYQVGLFEEQTNRWLYAGYGQEEAEALAATAVAIPGTSEHELGLAADIYSSENLNLDESQVNTFTQQWLMENCWHYGFILRYPKDKSEITGIIFEPWHYRYVGDEHARKIHSAEICLEEYLDMAEHPDEAGDSIAADYLREN